MRKRTWIVVPALGLSVLLMAVVCLFVGSSGMTVREGLSALFGRGTAAQIRIMRMIRLPRVLAALLAGAGLSVAGLLMQTTLNNRMASPSTLGVTNAAVFGANLSIILLSGGFLDTGHSLAAFTVGTDPFATGAAAFFFSLLSVFLILGLCRLRDFTPGVVVLAGIALSAVWSAATTVLQFYATDVGLSAAVIWSFGDLGRATYKTDLIMLCVLGVCFLLVMLLSWRYNALLSGEAAAVSLGVNVARLRFLSLLMASVMTAVTVAFLGTIGFVGIICPHVAKRLLGQDHRVTVPASALVGSLLLLCADTLSRSLGGGSALPVGAVTSLLGAPFFLALIFGRRSGSHAAD